MRKNSVELYTMLHHLFWPAVKFRSRNFPRSLLSNQCDGYCWLLPRKKGTSVVAVPRALRVALSIRSPGKQLCVKLLANVLTAVTRKKDDDWSEAVKSGDSEELQELRDVPVTRVYSKDDRALRACWIRKRSDGSAKDASPEANLEVVVDNLHWFQESDTGTIIEQREVESPVDNVRLVLSQLSPEKLMEKLVLRLLRCRLLWGVGAEVNLSELLSTDRVGVDAACVFVNCKVIERVPIVQVLCFPSATRVDRTVVPSTVEELQRVKHALDEHCAAPWLPMPSTTCVVTCISS